MSIAHTQCQPKGESARQHTPTPWMTHRAGEMLPDDWMIMADLGKLPNGIQQVSTIARALSIRQTPETTAANAAFIVEAVNNYEALKSRLATAEESLREAKGRITNLATECHHAKWEFDLSEDFRPTAKAARALILTAFRQLHRIGDLAIKAKDSAALSSVTGEPPRE